MELLLVTRFNGVLCDLLTPRRSLNTAGVLNQKNVHENIGDVLKTKKEVHILIYHKNRMVFAVFTRFRLYRSDQDKGCKTIWRKNIKLYEI